MVTNAIPFVTQGGSVVLVSFDRDADAAVREASEDRSLNLALRRRRVRSEVLRIPLNADPQTKHFLTDVISALRGRRLMILVRDLTHYPDALELMTDLCDVAEEVLVILVGDDSAAFAHPHAKVHYLAKDDREHIESLAEAVIVPQPG